MSAASNAHKYGSTQVVLVAHVYPQDLANACMQNPIMQREHAQEHGHGRVLQVPDDVLHIVVLWYAPRQVYKFYDPAACSLARPANVEHGLGPFVVSPHNNT